MRQAWFIREAIAKRLTECGLELNEAKTHIVYCKDDDRQGSYEQQQFDFLGYTFRPRRSKNRWGKYFINFTPAMSNAAGKAIRHEIRTWRINMRSDKTLEDLARMFNVIVQGWINFYGRFYKAQMYRVRLYWSDVPKARRLASA